MTHDWNAIREEYEQGASLRELAAKYGVSKSTIGERKYKEQWASRTDGRTDTIPSPLSAVRPDTPTCPPVSSDATTIARIGLQQLAQHLQTESVLEIKDHKSLSDALAQYVKVLLIAPQEGDQETGLFIDIGKLPAWKRMELRRLLASDSPQGEMM